MRVRDRLLVPLRLRAAARNVKVGPLTRVRPIFLGPRIVESASGKRRRRLGHGAAARRERRGATRQGMQGKDLGRRRTQLGLCARVNVCVRARVCEQVRDQHTGMCVHASVSEGNNIYTFCYVY